MTGQNATHIYHDDWRRLPTIDGSPEQILYDSPAES